MLPGAALGASFFGGDGERTGRAGNFELGALDFLLVGQGFLILAGDFRVGALGFLQVQPDFLLVGRGFLYITLLFFQIQADFLVVVLTFSKLVDRFDAVNGILRDREVPGGPSGRTGSFIFLQP